MPEENQAKAPPKIVKKAAASNKKYHVVRSKNPADVAEYIMPCPIEKRNGDNEAPIREFASLNIFCSNFVESYFLTDRKKYKINWEEIKEGLNVGMVDIVNEDGENERLEI